MNKYQKYVKDFVGIKVSSWLNLKTVDSEITNRCNAACTLCARTGIHNGVSDIIKGMKIRDVELDDWKGILTSKNGKNISKIYYCGNYGDPMMHPKAFEMFKQNQELGIKLQRPDTNGGMKNKSWWSELGKLKSLNVNFAIDGLSDTNHIYRRNTNYEKIIENARAYIDSGGNAFWTMIVFKHNQHQVEEAREVAKKYGFKNFSIKKTTAGLDPNNPEHSHIQPYRKRNVQPEIRERISFPTIKEYRANIISKGHQQYEVIPKCVTESQMYLTSDRLILPCCWTQTAFAKHMYTNKEPSSPTSDLSFYWFLEENKIKYDLTKYAFDDIMESYEEFYPGFEKGWKEKSFAICNKQCGSNFKTSR